MVYVATLGEVLKSARERANLSKSKLAKISGISRQYIAAIEEGKRDGRTSANLLMKLANALQISPEPFFIAMGFVAFG